MIIKIENERDQIMLEWLAAHGYDGGFLDLATFQGRSGLRYVYSLTEVDSWTFRETVNDDWDSFLACNGSATLASTLLVFLESIV